MGVGRPIDVTADQRKILLALLKRHLPNTTTWVYGSRVKWTSRPQSDLDLVVFTKPDQERRVSELREAFEESNLPFRVDLLVWRSIPEQYRKQIEAEHVVLVEREERGVAGEWGEIPLARLLAEPVRNGIYKKKEFHGRGMKIVNMGELFAHPRLSAVPMKRVELSESEADRFLISAGDLLFARRSLVAEGAGKCCVVLDVDEPTTFESSIIRVRLDSTKADYLYLYYFFNSALGLYHLDTIRRQVAVAGITGSDLAKLEIPVPPPPEQRAIAQVLGTLDDKIELNRRMNESLETMARALFKSWFIDFDPVRAKATLRNHSPLEGESASQGRSPQANRWGEIKRQYTQQTLQKAQTLRESQTDAEGLLWHYLRDKQLDGHKFRRQQPIGPYIVDFACMPQKLLIELDGGQHAEQHTYDQKRDEFLRQQGYKILRFWNNEIFENCFGVLENIYVALHHHSPLEGESVRQGRQPAAEPVGGGESVGHPPPHQPSPRGSASATPPQGGSDWSVERAQAYLDGMPPNIADLFPDRLVDSELGPIPEGWKVKALSKRWLGYFEQVADCR